VTPRLRLLVAVASLVFLVAHLRALPRTLEDIDSINFALGVEHFDVASHQPHPPGYPVFIALARASTAVVGWAAPQWDRDRRAAVGLAVWGVIAGTLALSVFTEFWITVGMAPALAFAASLVAVMSPLFWFTAARPLSDTPALVVSIAIAAGLFKGLRALHAGVTSVPRVWVISAIAAGLAIGIRSQTMWMTGPLLCWMAGELLVRRRVRDAGVLVGWAAVGALVWAVPLVVLSGGLSTYLHALGAQGTQDFTGIEMLATDPRGSLLRSALSRTFVAPWQAAALGRVIAALAIVGVARLAWRGRRILAAMALVFWPYLVFHLTFHETLTLRYALPLVLPVSALAVIALSLAGAYSAILGATAAAVWSLIVVQPRLLAYANDGAPVFRAFQDMQRALPSTVPPPVLRMHHQVYWGIRRVADWYRPVWDVGPLTHPGSREWLAVVDQFAHGDRRDVWFLGDVTRNDVALFDARARRLGGHYVLPDTIKQLVGGARLDSVDWWIISPPTWMLGRGWALTPEIAGMTDQDHAMPNLRPADGYLRRDPAPATLLLGGRDLSAADVPAGVVAIDLDGHTIDQLQVSPSSPGFVRWIDLPNGVPTGSTPYARLTVRVTSVLPDQPAPPVGLEQFDFATAGHAMFALGDGWFEPEEEPATGRLWRWSSAHGVLEVRDYGPSVTLVLAGESPLRYFDHPPTVVVRAGSREIARFSPAADFTQSIVVPADALDASSGQLSVDTDLTFAPAERGQSKDQRRLGLRLFSVEVR
jgi:hypothetical protein